jgi:hypothetical protein
LSEHKQLFAAKYVTYLPTEDELKEELFRDQHIVDAIREASPTKKAKQSAKKK